MSAEKDPIRAAHETLALIADKLSVERPSNSDVPPLQKPAPATQTAPPAPPTPAAEAAPAETPPASATPPAPAGEQSAPETPPAAAEPPPTPTAETPPAPVAVPAPTAAQAAVPPQPSPTPAPEAVRVVPAPSLSASKKKERSPFREAMLTYFPMLIAILSIGLSVYQGYLFNQSIDVMQRNVARGEYIRTCREIIETYFLVKQKVGVLMPAADRGNIAGASRVTENNRLEAQAAVAKFGGLGTYLANFQDTGTRARYTDLTKTLAGILENARNVQLSEIDKLFAPAEKLFAQMNEDCARLARAIRM